MGQGRTQAVMKLVPVRHFAARLHETSAKCLVPGFGTK